MPGSEVKIISIGAAVEDVFLQGKIFRAHKDDDGDMVEEFAIGSKNEIEGVSFCTGGGGTNAAVTFARQGFHSSYMGRIGHDIAGKVVLDDLHKEGVDTSLVDYSKFGTGYSTLLLAPNGERTILTYRGASAHYELKEADFHSSKADWFYISSLSGDFDALDIIVNYAQAHDIKVAINPGKNELSHAQRFRQILPKITLLSANKEETASLFNGDSIEHLAVAGSKQVSFVVVTDGPRGSVVCDGKKLYKAGLYEDVKVVDRAGAGDAFSSGLVAMIAKGESVPRAMTFAAANSTSVVGQIGAKPGILHQNAKIHRMSIEVTEL